MSTPAGVVCGICHDVVEEVGEVDCCEHRFCFECIFRWTEIESRCPFCKASVKLIQRKRLDLAQLPAVEAEGPTGRLHGSVLEEVEVEERVQKAQGEDDGVLVDGQEYEIDDPMAHLVCLLCGDGQDDEHLLLCDACDQGVHTYCVGLSAVPEGDFFCPDCRSVEGLDEEVPRPRSRRVRRAQAMEDIGRQSRAERQTSREGSRALHSRNRGRARSALRQRRRASSDTLFKPESGGEASEDDVGAAGSNSRGVRLSGRLNQLTRLRRASGVHHGRNLVSLEEARRLSQMLDVEHRGEVPSQAHRLVESMRDRWEQIRQGQASFADAVGASDVQGAPGPQPALMDTEAHQHALGVLQEHRRQTLDTVPSSSRARRSTAAPEPSFSARARAELERASRIGREIGASSSARTASRRPSLERKRPRPHSTAATEDDLDMPLAKRMAASCRSGGTGIRQRLNPPAVRASVSAAAMPGRHGPQGHRDREVRGSKWSEAEHECGGYAGPSASLPSSASVLGAERGQLTISPAAGVPSMLPLPPPPSPPPPLPLEPGSITCVHGETKARAQQYDAPDTPPQAAEEAQTKVPELSIKAARLELKLAATGLVKPLLRPLLDAGKLDRPTFKSIARAAVHQLCYLSRDNWRPAHTVAAQIQKVIALTDEDLRAAGLPASAEIIDLRGQSMGMLTNLTSQ